MQYIDSCLRATFYAVTFIIFIKFMYLFFEHSSVFSYYFLQMFSYYLDSHLFKKASQLKNLR